MTDPHPPPSGPAARALGSTLFDVSLPSDISHGAELRRLVRTWCAEQQISQEAIADVLLVTSELFTNAARASLDGPVAVSLRLRPPILSVSVENQGAAFNYQRVLTPVPNRAGGRGLFIAQTLGAVTVSHNAGTTTVSVDLPAFR